MFAFWQSKKGMNFKMKSEKGMTFLMLIILIIIIVVISIIAIFFVWQNYEKEEFESIRTDMLLIQGKIKVLEESSVAKKDESIKKGTKLNEMEEDNNIKMLLDKQIISKEEENYDNYYILNKDNLNEIGLNSIKVKEGNYIIVNYKTDEIIYTQGITIDNNQYYKLSEINKIKEEKEVALNEQALQKQQEEEQKVQSEEQVQIEENAEEAEQETEENQTETEENTETQE